nr:membrane protein [Streptococcus thermophilus]
MNARRIGPLLMGLGAMVLWLASRLTWMTVAYADDRTGDGQIGVAGGEWSTEVTAVVLLLLAATVAGLALTKIGRRIVGAVGAAAAALVTLPPLTVLISSPDPERIKALLTYGGEEGAIGSTTGQAALPEWAQIAEVTTHLAGPLLGVLGAVAAAAGGIFLAVRPGEDTASKNKYEKASQRREKIEQDLQDEPESGRVLWDAIDADIDPTDQGAQFRRGT